MSKTMRLIAVNQRHAPEMPPVRGMQASDKGLEDGF